MPTSKTQPIKSTKSGLTKRIGVAKGPRAASRPAKAMTKFIAPGAALLGGGLLVAAGVLMRQQLERLLHAGLKSAGAGSASARKAAEQLDLQKLLAHVGLQPKRHSVMEATLGAFAGLISGSALTLWLAPVLRQRVESRRAPSTLSKEPATNNSMHVGPSV